MYSIEGEGGTKSAESSPRSTRKRARERERDFSSQGRSVLRIVLFADASLSCAPLFARSTGPLTTALTRSVQSGLTQFSVQFARLTRIRLKPAENENEPPEKNRS